MANERDPSDTPADPIDGYKPAPLGDTAPQRDPAVHAAARADAEQAQARSRTRWDAQTIDAFVNALTGLGDPTQDKVLGGVNGALKFIVTFLSGSECEDRWRGSDLGGRVVEQVPAEMTRMGFELSVQPDESEDLGAGGGSEAAGAERVQGPLGLPNRIDGASARRRRDTYARTLERRQAARRRRDWPDSQGEGAGMKPEAAPSVVELPFVDEEGQGIVEEMEAQLRDLDALSAFRLALEYERAYGGAGILLGVDDGVTNDLTQPLRVDQIKRVKHLEVFRGGWDGELIAWRYYNDPRKPNFGMPEIYMLRNLGVPISAPPAPGEGARVMAPQLIPAGDYQSLIYYVHESRLLIFPGKAVSRRARVQMRGWGDSVFMRVDEVLSQYSQTWQAIASIMVEWSMGVLKMAGLADMFSTQGDPMNLPSGGTGPAPSSPLETLAARIRAINLGKSNAHTFLIDGEEEFKRETSPLSGLAEVLQSFMLRLAAAVDMPVSLLMGQSPGGLRAGDDDVRFFYDRIMSKISSNLLPLWRRLLVLLFLSTETSPTGGQEPRKWTTTPRPLHQLTEKEVAEMRKTVAETDVLYIDRQVQSPAETTSSRFGGAKWSMETTIDFEGRANAAARARLAAQAAAAKPAGAPGASGGIDLTPSAEAAVTTVNEARAAKGLPPWPDEAEGKLTVAEFQAKRASIIAQAANAEAGKTGAPPPANEPKPAPMLPGAPGQHQLGPGGKPPASPPALSGAPPEPPKGEPESPAEDKPKPAPPPPAKAEPPSKLDQAERVAQTLVNMRRAGYVVEGEPLIEEAGLKVKGRLGDDDDEGD